MERYQVILAYDGTQYLGYQRQENEANSGGYRTIQGVVEAALRRIGWLGGAILAAGRTDTGVHASGQVIAFDLEWKHTPDDLVAALNANLPIDVAAQSARLKKPDFHPRYDAIARRYCYRVFCQPVRNPMRERYCWRVWPPVELDRLHSTAAKLVGTHDFVAFGKPPRPEGTTIRTVFQAGWRIDDEDFEFGIQADAFLYRMVRRLVYAQILIGQNKWSPELMFPRPENMERRLIQGLAPPQGLVLAEVTYE